MKSFFVFIFLLIVFSFNQLISAEIKGTTKNSDQEILTGTTIKIEKLNKGAISDSKGIFEIKNIPEGRYLITATTLGYKSDRREIIVTQNEILIIDFVLSRVDIKLNEIVVTANKTEENQQIIPISVSAITNERIEDLNIKQRNDISAIAPNTLVAESGSHLTDLINIRGVFPSNFFTTTSLFFFEGVPIFGYGQNPMYLNDIERIEILRGPQGTIYGRNSLAGVINIVSKKPSNINSYNLGLTYGNYNDFNFNIGTSQSLIDDKLFSRISAYYYSRDGYYTNTFLNSNAGGSKGYGGSLALRYFPSEEFSAELFGNLEYIDENIWPLALNPETALDDPYKISRDIDSYVKKYNLLSSLKLSYYLDFMKIVSTTAYQTITGLDWKYDADFTQYEILGFESRTPENTFSQELRFENQDVNKKLKWMIGLFYLNSRKDDNYNAMLLSYKKQINQSISPYGMEITNLDQYTQGKTNVSNIAIFGNISYTLFNNFDINIGYRYEKENSDIDCITYFDYKGTLPNPIPDLLKPSLGFLNIKDTNKRTLNTDFFSHKYAMSYRFDNNNMLFINISSGVHGGGFNSGSNKVHPTYDNEYTWNYELGYKGTLLDNKLRINSSLFFIDWKNQQLLIVGDLSSPLQTISNAGKTQIKGYELELSAILMEGLSLNMSLGIMDAKLTEYKFTDKLNGKDTLFDYSGNKLPFSPDINSNISLKYEYPVQFLQTNGRVAVELDYQYLSSYYCSHINLYKSDPRSIMNCKLGYYTTNWDLFLSVKNLADLRYVFATYEYRGGTNAYLGAPRTYGLNLVVKL